MSPIDKEIEQCALVAAVRSAIAEHTGMAIRGGGSKDFYGVPRNAQVLDTRGHTGIIDYQPTELVLTARAGTPLAEIERALAEHGQFLAFEPPRFSGNATLGGCVAAGLSGPGRAARGAVRDFVLGISVIDGRGQVLNFGGQVMKNVAGYDVPRLFAGSLGTLGVILDVSIKVLPLPQATATVQFDLEQSRAIDLANRLAGQPIGLTASAWHAGVLSIRLSGAHSAIEAACERLGGQRLSDETSGSFWELQREQTDPFFAGPTPLWRFSVPSSTEAFRLEDDPAIEWGGAVRWFRSDAKSHVLFDIARARGGHATLFRGSDEARRESGVFMPRAQPIAVIEERLRFQFDPECLFNPEALAVASN
jgi:glycolate oxidase FAD binding subunit